MSTGFSTQGGNVLAAAKPVAESNTVIINAFIDGAARYRTAVLNFVPYTFYMLIRTFPYKRYHTYYRPICGAVLCFSKTYPEPILFPYPYIYIDRLLAGLTAVSGLRRPLHTR